MKASIDPYKEHFLAVVSLGRETFHPEVRDVLSDHAKQMLRIVRISTKKGASLKSLHEVRPVDDITLEATYATLATLQMLHLVEAHDVGKTAPSTRYFATDLGEDVAAALVRAKDPW